jgi:hypothetical protein
VRKIWSRAGSGVGHFARQLEARGAHSLIDVATDDGRVRTGEAAVKMRERLAVHQRKSAGEGARLERLGDPRTRSRSRLPPEPSSTSVTLPRRKR